MWRDNLTNEFRFLLGFEPLTLDPQNHFFAASTTLWGLELKPDCFGLVPIHM